MKILVLSHMSELVGGAERSILEVMDILSEKYRAKPEFILRKPLGNLTKELEKRNWNYYGVRYTHWSETNPSTYPPDIFSSVTKNTKAIIKIEKIIKETKPDIVLTNSIVCPWAALAAYYQRVPHVWFVREYGDLDHGRTFEIGRQKTFEDIDNLSELVITNSKTLESHVKKYVNNKKITTLYHPFDIKKIKELGEEKIKSPYRYKNSIKVVITSGAVTPSKGQEEAITAVGELNKEGFNTEICIIGRRDNKDFLRSLKEVIDKYNIGKKVHFVGWKKNPLSIVSLADLGITASRKEAFGRLTFEYLALGKPVIGTDSGATPEMIKPDINGYLYKNGDIEELTNSLRKYAENPHLLIDHGKASSEKAVSMMQGQNNIDNLFKKIKEVSISKVTTPQPINYTHKLLEYPKSIEKYIDYIEKVPLKNLLFHRSKLQAKKALKKTGIRKKT